MIILPILISIIFILSSILIILKLFNFGLNLSHDDSGSNIQTTTHKPTTTKQPLSTSCPKDVWISSNNCSLSRSKMSGEVPTYYFRETFNSGKEKCKKTQIREFKTNSLDEKCTGPFTIVG